METLHHLHYLVPPLIEKAFTRHLDCMRAWSLLRPVFPTCLDYRCQTCLTREGERGEGTHLKVFAPCWERTENPPPPQIRASQAMSKVVILPWRHPKATIDCHGHHRTVENKIKKKAGTAGKYGVPPITAVWSPTHHCNSRCWTDDFDMRLLVLAKYGAPPITAQCIYSTNTHKQK